MAQNIFFALCFGHLWHHQRPLLPPKIQAHFCLCVLPLYCPQLHSSSFFCCYFMSKVPFPKCSVFSFSTSFLNSHFLCLPAGCTLLCFFFPFSPSEYLDKAVYSLHSMMRFIFFCFYPSFPLFMVSLTASMKPQLYSI